MVIEVSSTTKPAHPVKAFLNPLIYWALFILASYLMSLVFQSFRLFTLTPDLKSMLSLVGVVLLLLLNLALLAFDSYVKERAKGNIHKPVMLFERLVESFQKSKLDGGAV